MSSRHQLTRFPRTLAARFVAGGAALLVLVGCGTGQVTQTDSQAASTNGGNADIGNTIALRDVLMHYPVDQDGVYPAGSDIPLSLTIVNNGQSADTLASVTSEVSQEALVEGATTVPAQASVIVIVDEDALSASPTQTTVLPSPLNFGELRIVLTDINQAVRVGQNIEVTFAFEQAGATTVSVPMALPPDTVEREPLEGDEQTDGH